MIYSEMVQPQAGTEQVQEIALSELHEFKVTHLRYWTMKKMQETVESVREHGVLMRHCQTRKRAVMKLLQDTAGDMRVSL